MTSFTWSVLIDGSDIAGLVPDGEATITYGRQDVDEQPTPTTATLTLITPDARDYTGQMANAYPEFTLGDHSIKSGFEDKFTAKYEGALTRVRLGTPVTIGSDTPSGFDDIFTASYANGLNLVRFVGHIAAIDYEPERIQLTCAGNMGPLTRQRVTPSDWPAEPDVARALRIWPALQVQGAAAVQVAAVPLDDKARPVSVYQALTSLASDAGAVVYADRDGSINYRTAQHAPAHITLPPTATLLEPLAMTAELGLIMNSVEVRFGGKDNEETVTRTDAASIASYGLLEQAFDTQLAVQQDAEDYADLMLARFAQPHWSMPTVEVNLGMGNDADIAHVAAVDLGDTVYVPTLLPGSPASSYTANALGYTETLSATNWTMNIHLSPLANPISRSST